MLALSSLVKGLWNVKMSNKYATNSNFNDGGNVGIDIQYHLGFCVFVYIFERSPDDCDPDVRFVVQQTPLRWRHKSISCLTWGSGVVIQLSVRCRTTRNEREGVAERQTFTLYARARDERIHFVSESSSGGGVVSAVNVLVSPPPAFTHGLWRTVPSRLRSGSAAQNSDADSPRALFPSGDHFLMRTWCRLTSWLSGRSFSGFRSRFTGYDVSVGFAKSSRALQLQYGRQKRISRIFELLRF